LSYHCKYFI